MQILGQDLANYKRILVKELIFLDKLCKCNGIKYFAVGGTAIGAVRHQGFIPWDDDIDVAMLREDYDRFIALKESITDSQYRILDYHDDGYFLPSAKIVDINTTLWELEEQPYVMGAYIDVFPLDYVDKQGKDLEKEVSHYKKCFEALRQSKATMKLSNTFHRLKQGKVLSFGYRLYQHLNQILCINPFRKRILRKADECVDMIRTKKGKTVLNYNHLYPLDRELFDAKWFGTTISMPFEDTTIEIPADYDVFLRHTFDDYMQLPSEEKRVGHHSCFYYNLNKHMDTTKGILKIVKKHK